MEETSCPETFQEQLITSLGTTVNNDYFKRLISIDDRNLKGVCMLIYARLKITLYI